MCYKHSSKVALVIAVILTALSSSTARADLSSGSWYLDHSNEFASVTNYAQVTIDADSSAGTVMFTVDALDVQPLYGALNNFGIQKFGFNFENVTSASAGWAVSLPSGWHQSTNENLGGGFGSFEVAETGTGSNRSDPLVFTLTLPEADEAVAGNFAVANAGGWFFSAHVAGFGTAPGSHKVAGSTPVPPGSTPVPAPGAVALGLIGLTMIGRLRRAA